MTRKWEQYWPLGNFLMTALISRTHICFITTSWEVGCTRKEESSTSCQQESAIKQDPPAARRAHCQMRVSLQREQTCLCGPCTLQSSASYQSVCVWVRVLEEHQLLNSKSLRVTLHSGSHSIPLCYQTMGMELTCRLSVYSKVVISLASSSVAWVNRT